MKRFLDDVNGGGEEDVNDQKKVKSEDQSGFVEQGVEDGLPPREGGSRYGGSGRGRGRGGGYRRRDSYGDRDRGGDRYRGELGAAQGSQDPALAALMSGEVTIKVTINLRKEMAGAVIGKGGAKVSKMREETGAQIHVCPPSRKNDVERAVELTGTLEKVQKAEEAVYELMVETDKDWCEVESSGTRIEIQILPEMVGCLIGRQGSRVKAIREELDVSVHVESQKDEANMQLVSVSGTAEKAHIAHGRIMEHLKEFDPSRSKILLRRVQNQRTKPMDLRDGGAGRQAGGAGPMVVLSGQQMPQLTQVPQVLIQQTDGTYTLAQVQIQGGVLGGGAGVTPMTAQPGFGAQNGVQVVQPSQHLQMQSSQLSGSTGFGVQGGQQLDAGGYMQPQVQAQGALPMYAAMGMDQAQNVQFAMQPGQQPNPNAQPFGN